MAKSQVAKPKRLREIEAAIVFVLGPLRRPVKIRRLIAQVHHFLEFHFGEQRLAIEDLHHGFFLSSRRAIILSAIVFPSILCLRHLVVGGEGIGAFVFQIPSFSVETCIAR